MTAITTSHWFASGGDMGERIRTFPWDTSPLGPIEQWPSELTSTLSICLSARFPMAIYWGAEGWLLYNDSWRPILGDKHPWAMGRSAHEVWPEIWDAIDPLFEIVRATGQATLRVDELLPMHRFGYTEECYFDYSFNPIRGRSGQVEGILNIVQETTYRVLNDRRTRLLRELASCSGSAKDEQDACALSVTALATDQADIPFALLYRIDRERREARLVAATGLQADHPARQDVVNLSGTSEPHNWPLASLLQDRSGLLVEDLAERFGVLPGGVWPEPVRQALLLPMTTAGQEEIGTILVIGISPRRPLDDDYRHFLTMVESHIVGAITNARAYSFEKRRAEALAELDRAKTEFFSNVSHEFRTPLTLMLGPIEEEMRERPNTPRLEVAHRNSLRLLKLVNHLLDFSRIEAGRIEARYRPTDLSALTAELASCFRSAVEKAGLALVVDCPPLLDPAYVDREMWEKIVLNLISNAFKFTFEGEIAVLLRQRSGMIELRIRDTGLGIPPEAIPHLFERFYRVHPMRSRTHEGSGIGLALVHDLVHLHGGTVHVTSQVGQGSTFCVALPLGKTHLPTDKIFEISEAPPQPSAADTYLEEAAYAWRDEFPFEAGAPETTSRGHQHPESEFASRVLQKPRILIVEDNADMRQYIARLLTPHYHVIAVTNGQAALAEVQAQLPDLILSDVMMPHLDGFELLRAVRADPVSRAVPMILLSARAGEEARIEGLEQGVDDYLVKPFSARELLARVESHVKIAQMRAEMTHTLRESEERYRTLFESIGDGFCIVQMLFDEADTPTDYRFLEANPAFEEETGLKRAVDKTALEMVPGLDRWWIDTYGAVALTGQPARFDHHADAMGRWFEVYAFRFGLPANRQVAIFFKNITERKRAEEALRESEERFRNMADNSPMMLWITDTEGRCTYLNQRWYEFTGQSPETGLEFGWLNALHPDDREASGDIFRNATERHAPFRAEYRVRRRDGAYRWAIDAAAPRLSPSGQFLGYIGSVIDVTERKQTELDLRASEARFRAIVGQATVGVAQTDLTGRFMLVNPRFCDIVGYSETELLGMTMQQITHPDDLRSNLEQFGRLVQGGPDFVIEKRYQRQDGADIWVSVSVGAVRDGGGLQSVLAVALDIHERKQAEAQLQRFALELEQRVSERTIELTQSREHLRALATELNLAGQRERQQLATELHDYLAQLLALSRIRLAQATRQPLAPAVKQTLTEVEEVIDQALAYTRTLVAQLSPPMLKEFGLPMALRWLAEQMKQRDLLVYLEMEADAPMLPEDHAMLLFQSVRELLMNIVKHAETDHARITVKEADGWLTITVADEGIGFQLAASPAHAKESTVPGFGLFSIRERVLALGGRFELQSHPGQGTQATLITPLTTTTKDAVGKDHGASADVRSDTPPPPTFDAERVVHPLRTPSTAPSRPPIRVLIADDHAMVRQGLCGLLASFADIDIVGEAAQGQEAVAMALRLQPDVILMDVNMPVMDGIDATRRIIESLPTTTIIGLSVQTVGHIETAMKKAGAVAFLNKEAAVEDLYKTIQAVSRER